LLNDSLRNRKFWDMVESDCSPSAAYNISRQLFSRVEVAALMSLPHSALNLPLYALRSLTSAPGSMSSDLGSLPQSPRFVSHAATINEVSRRELTGYMANTLLRDTDQMSMAHALEVRVPFIDPVVVGYVLALSGKWKMDDARPKPLLVDALGDLLPEQIWKRPKMGFALPFRRWMTAGLKAGLDDALANSEKIAQSGLNTDRASKVWDDFKTNAEQQPWSRPWALYVLQRWCEHNDVRA
jgi:asparagine synthase (glutamine-hydrolysing)